MPRQRETRRQAKASNQHQARHTPRTVRGRSEWQSRQPRYGAERSIAGLEPSHQRGGSIHRPCDRLMPMLSRVTTVSRYEISTEWSRTASAPRALVVLSLSQHSIDGVRRLCEQFLESHSSQHRNCSHFNQALPCCGCRIPFSISNSKYEK